MQCWQAKTSVKRGALGFLDRLQLVGPHSPQDSPGQRQQFFFHFAAGVTTGQTACGTATGSQAWEKDSFPAKGI